MQEVDSVDADEGEYTVEAIRGWRYNYRANCRKEFLIKWLNYPESQNTFEPEDHLSCPAILQRFIDTFDEKQLKYFYSSDPRKLNGFQRNAMYIRCVGADGPHESDEEDSDDDKYFKNSDEGENDIQTGRIPNNGKSFVSRKRKRKANKQRFYLLVQFDDSDMVEEVTLNEFFEYQPDEAFKFFESRFVYTRS